MHFLDLRIEKGNGIIICKETREKGACRLQGFFHSGFLVETAKRYFIFDYYKGELPKLNPDKPVYVFATMGIRIIMNQKYLNF